METWEVIKKKCPVCGAELHVNLMYCNADDLCKVRYHCNCGWWVCMEKIPLKDVVARMERDEE